MLESPFIEMQQCVRITFEHSFNFLASIIVHTKGAIPWVFGVLGNQTNYEIPFNEERGRTFFVAVVCDLILILNDPEYGVQPLFFSQVHYSSQEFFILALIEIGEFMCWGPYFGRDNNIYLIHQGKESLPFRDAFQSAVSP